MIRTALAGVLFAVVYGIALRLYQVLRARRASERWHGSAVAWSALLGGAAFYAAQQVRSPHVPGWLDVPAFLILAIAAAAIPLLFELVTVVAARAALRGAIAVPKSKAGGSGDKAERQS